MRKISSLKEMPFSRWHKDELIDFIQHYILYFDKNREKDNLLNIDEFLTLDECSKYYAKDIEDIKKI